MPVDGKTFFSLRIFPIVLEMLYDGGSGMCYLPSEPAAVVLLRGVNAFRRTHSFVASLHTGQGDTMGLHHKDLCCIISPTPDITYQQAMVFFHRRELYADPSTRWLLPYLPPCYVTLQTRFVLVYCFLCRDWSNWASAVEIL